jgi:hypothetical protein
MKKCKNCSAILKTHQYKYCSNRCQIDFQYKTYIAKWKQDCAKGGKGIATKNISRHLKKYLIEHFGEKCSICGWDRRHPLTKKVPLEVDHINGDAENNHIKNLRLICPNCHALTPHFRNLNKGNGRTWRIINRLNEKVS